MGAPETVVVIAHWQTTESALDAVLGYVAQARPRSLAEPGCLGYDVLQAVDDPTSITLIERYRDDDALDAHRTSAHFQEVIVGRIVPLLTARRVEILRPSDST